MWKAILEKDFSEIWIETQTFPLRETYLAKRFLQKGNRSCRPRWVNWLIYLRYSIYECKIVNGNVRIMHLSALEVIWLSASLQSIGRLWISILTDQPWGGLTFVCWTSCWRTSVFLVIWDAVTLMWCHVNDIEGVGCSTTCRTEQHLWLLESA